MTASDNDWPNKKDVENYPGIYFIFLLMQICGTNDVLVWRSRVSCAHRIFSLQRISSNHMASYLRRTSCHGMISYHGTVSSSRRMAFLRTDLQPVFRKWYSVLWHDSILNHNGNDGFLLVLVLLPIRSLSHLMRSRRGSRLPRVDGSWFLCLLPSFAGICHHRHFWLRKKESFLLRRR